ncbi:MAG: erythromycin esterase family protein [bacterium]|nr:erythromycin esterase family protein [bacterium]
MNERRLALIGSVMLACTFFLAAAASGDEIRPGIHTFHGIYANLPNDDLEPVAAMIGDAPIVALGESDHTSGGYYRLKYRLFRYLVEEQGFRAFAIESPWERAESVAEYVATCEGSPEEAVKGLFGVWQSESMRDLVKWMCAWNHRHPDDPVHFSGFDEQQPDRDAAALKDYLKRFGLKDDDPRVRGIDRCDQSRPFGGLSDSDYAECIKRLDQIWRYFDRRESTIVRRTSAEDLEWARIRLVGFKAWQQQKHHRHSARPYRDEAMAYILLAIRNLRFPGVKTVVWAHNYHIAKMGTAYAGKVTTGAFLADALGDDYVSLALIAYNVEFDWPNEDLCGPSEDPIYPSSVEQRLSELNEPYLFVDLDFPGVSSPFLEAGRTYWISGYRTVVRDDWDGIFYLDHSPPMVPVNREPCR